MKEEVEDERMGRRWTRTLTVFTLTAAVVLTGCATIRDSQAQDTGRLLSAAGFTMQHADAAEQQLGATPPYHLVSRTRNGAVEYVYADPDHCKCVYVGGPAEYAKYRRLHRQDRIATDPWAPCDYEGLCWPW
jgi:uncharacterized protein YceK